MTEHDPKYVVIRERIRSAYLDGRPGGEALPTERALAEDFGVNRATVRRALTSLEDDGLLYRIQGAGTFSMGSTIAKSLRLTSFSEDVEMRGMTPSSLVLSAIERAAGAKSGRDLQISPNEPVFEIRRLRLADAEPMCVEDAVLSKARFPGLLDHRLEGSLYEVIEGSFIGHRIARAEQVVRATVVDEELARHLSVPAFSPALEIERVVLDQRSKPMEHAISVYRADRYEVHMGIRRES